VSYSNSYEHGLYIQVRTKEALHCSVVRGGQTKKWMDEKKEPEILPIYY
jgi:hypothetical protein